MRGVSSPARLANYLPRGGRWAVLGMLVTFTLIGLFQRHHDNEALAVLAALVAIGGGVLMIEPRGVPLPVYGVISSAGVAMLCNGSSSNVGWLAICLLAGWCGLASGWRVGLVYWACAVVLFGSEWIWVDPDPGWAPWMAGTTFTVAAAALIRQNLDVVAQLRAAQASLAETARAEERNRIARELHDVIAHTLIVSQLHVASARLAVENDPTDAVRSLAEAERLGRESLAEVRRAVGLLRADEDGGTVAPLPGAADLPALVERFRSAGTDATLAVTGELDSVPATTGLALYRVVQEALTNAVRHASGWPVTVEVDLDAARAELVVETGAPPGRGTGLGLDNMRERAGSVGGRCEAGPGGRGWQVRAELPLGRVS